MEVATSDVGKIATAICWENYMPLFRAHLYNQSPQIYCAPTVDDREIWLATMKMIALEGRCFVVSASQYMRLSDVCASWYTPIQGTDPDTVLIRGGTCIISPLGEVISAPVFDRNDIVLAELDMDAIARGKFDLDVAGHYARPDVFELIANTRPSDRRR